MERLNKNKNSLEKIKNINKKNKFLIYITKRVQRNDYRILHKSQHNRYSLGDVQTILASIYKVVCNDFFKIPLGDWSNNYENKKKLKEIYKIYIEILENIEKEMNRTTINSLKKNFFVEFSRLGFLERFDKNKNKLDPLKRSAVHYVKLTDKGVQLVRTKSMSEKYNLFSQQVIIFFDPVISDILDALWNSNYRNDSIEFIEFQYILSDTTKNSTEKIELLDSYRSLSKREKNKVLLLLKEYCDPNNFKGESKTNKRDFHNWKNETQQIMHLLNNTHYFNISKNEFRLKSGEYSVFPEVLIKQRSSKVKEQYFEKHNLEKKENFELHHIVPISSAKNKEEIKLIDNFQNLIYLSKEKHKTIKRECVLLKITDLFVEFKNINDKTSIKAQNGKAAYYNLNMIKKMSEYNLKIVKKIYKVT